MITSPALEKLKNLPGEIASVRRQLIEISNQLQVANGVLKSIEQDVDLDIAFSSALKNEAQRKAQRSQCLGNDPDYAYWEVQATSLRVTQARLEIQVAFLANQFTVTQLEVRMELAQLEALKI